VRSISASSWLMATLRVTAMMRSCSQNSFSSVIVGCPCRPAHGEYLGTAIERVGPEGRKLFERFLSEAGQ
jgi:hypothetical protein